jgi:hypothetical protein
MKNVTGFEWVQSAYAQKPIRAKIWAMFMRSLQQMLSVFPTNFNTTFRSSSHRGGHSLEYSWFHSVSWQVCSTRCCNTSKSLMDAECTQTFGCPHSQKSRWWILGERVGQLTGSLLCIHCSRRVWFKWSDNPEKMRWYPVMHEPHVLSLMKRHMF